jgi:hypothetical protein
MRKAREKLALTAAHTCSAARELLFDPGSDAPADRHLVSCNDPELTFDPTDEDRNLAE